MSLLKEDLWSILTDPLCIFRGCSGSRHLSSRVIHQSSMSSYTSSSKGRAEDGCSLWREYLSWRRSPTSLMTFSACGDIYTMKKKKNAVSLKANMKSEDVYRCRDTSLVKPNCKLGPKQERSLVWTFTFFTSITWVLEQSDQFIQTRLPNSSKSSFYLKLFNQGGHIQPLSAWALVNATEVLQFKLL